MIHLRRMANTNIESIPFEIQTILETKFALSAFRPGQKEVIDAVMAGRDTLAVMPTGGGKSLCYQLPAVCKTGVTIVVSPLISLMRDQVFALRQKGIPCGSIHSGQSIAEKESVFKNLRVSKSYLLYLSPERIQSPGFSKWLMAAPIGLFAIDEAHCLSQWGHDFREDYSKLNLLRTLRPEVPILATTATATPQVLADIAHQLHLKNPSKHVHGFYRPNLYYQVEYCEDDQEKLNFLHAALSETKEGRIIIYAGTRKKCEELHEILAPLFPDIDYYHAGLSSDERESIHDQYEKENVRILIATNAFGMGVDHPNVRLVVHYQMPANVESYYQEVGRAGRDGFNSTCLLLYAKKDKGLQSYFIINSKAPRSITDNKWRALEAMVQFCEGGECRHAGILTYFKDTKRIEHCGHCDVCVTSSDRKISRKKISIVGAGKAPLSNGFLRKTKAKSKKAKKNTFDSSVLTNADQMLMRQIKAWRLDYAKSKDIPAFLVFSDKSLHDLVKKMPKTSSDLRKVYGFGPQKIEQFGSELLQALHR